MSIYAIGDIQGCYDDLRRLLDRFKFDKDCDQIWLTGDVVNRGPSSLKTLRFVKSLGRSAVTVLGNHDLHLLAAHYTGFPRRNAGDTLDKVLRAKDADELIDWLRKRPLLYVDKKIRTVMVHAGIPPQWTIKKAQRQAEKLESILRSKQAKKFLADLYSPAPRVWSDKLSKKERRQYALAAFTRMRFIHPNGRLDYSQKGPPGKHTRPLKPWFEAKNPRWRDDYRIVFGHWSTLGDTGRDDVICLDGGCVWGGRLIAAKLTAKPGVKYTKIRCVD